MKPIIIILCLFLFGHTSYCQDWLAVGTDSNGDKWYIKSSYVKKDLIGNSGYKIRIWTKKEIKTITFEKDGKPLTYMNVKVLNLYVADCRDGRLKIITTTVYNSQDKVIDSYTLKEDEQEWIDVNPDSMDEKMLYKICELFKG